MGSLFNRNTDGVTGSESAEPNTASKHAASDVPTTVVNPLYAGESAGEHAMPAGTSAPAPDTRAYVAEPAPQQTVSTKEHDDKQPSRAANLLLVATLAAVCGLAGGLAGGAIMSAATGGSAQAAQGDMGGGQGGMQGGAPGTDGTTAGGATGDTSENSAEGTAPNGQAPTDTPDAGGPIDSSDNAAGNSSTDVVDNSATSQTSPSA